MVGGPAPCVFGDSDGRPAGARAGNCRVKWGDRPARTDTGNASESVACARPAGGLAAVAAATGTVSVMVTEAERGGGREREGE